MTTTTRRTTTTTTAAAPRPECPGHDHDHDHDHDGGFHNPPEGLTLTVTADRASAGDGETVTFTVTVQNTTDEPISHTFTGAPEVAVGDGERVVWSSACLGRGLHAVGEPGSIRAARTQVPHDDVGRRQVCDVRAGYGYVDTVPRAGTYRVFATWPDNSGSMGEWDALPIKIEIL